MRGRVFDGHSARGISVAVEMGQAALRLSFDDDGAEDIPLSLLSRGDAKPGRVVFHRRDAPDWRLVITEAVPVEWGRQLQAVDGLRPRTIFICCAIAIMLFGGLTGLWFSGDRLLNIAASAAPHRVMAPIGRAFITQIGQDRLCRNPEGQAALDRLLARLRPAGGFVEPVQVTVVDIGWVNAFAAPGGQIVILRGLIDKAKSPDEVAGVLAHELTHVQLRHPTRALIRHAGLSILIQSVAGGMGEAANAAIMLGGSRDAERAADVGALKLLDNANISSAGLAAFFKRMAVPPKNADKANPLLDRLGSFISTHPGDAERLQAIIETKRQDAATTPAMTDEDWEDLRTICGNPVQEDD